jgi:hypothetical protein
MTQRAFLTGFLATVLWLAGASSADASYRGGFYRGSYGGWGRSQTYYNRYTGGYHHAAGGYNPYTGRYGGTRSYYNPYTGWGGTIKAVHDPYTGRLTYRFYRY